jgi:Holliday junction resolvase-like predicted endonuclease
MDYFNEAFTSSSCTSRKGAASELAACIWLLANGYEVFRNIAQSGPFDIVAVKGEVMLKLDVKSLGMGDGKNPPVNRAAQRVVKELGGNVLYIDKHGACKFDYELDDKYHLPPEAIKRGGGATWRDVPTRTINCKHCSKEFTCKSKTKLYCSQRCSVKAADKREQERRTASYQKMNY